MLCPEVTAAGVSSNYLQPSKDDLLAHTLTTQSPSSQSAKFTKDQPHFSPCWWPPSLGSVRVWKGGIIKWNLPVTSWLLPSLSLAHTNTCQSLDKYDGIASYNTMLPWRWRSKVKAHGGKFFSMDNENLFLFVYSLFIHLVFSKQLLCFRNVNEVLNLHVLSLSFMLCLKGCSCEYH